MVVLIFVLVRQARVLQAQGELAVFRSTLGALRTALVIDHLHKNVAAINAPMPQVQRNPFELLEQRPVNYAGEIRQIQAVSVLAGSWVFDADCACVGYAPREDQWLEGGTGNPLLWFEITGEPGPLQLTAKQTYIWQGQVIN